MDKQLKLILNKLVYRDKLHKEHMKSSLNQKNVNYSLNNNFYFLLYICLV